MSVRVLTKAQPFVPVPVSRGQQPRIAAAPSLAQPVTRCLGAEQALYIIKAIPQPLLGSPHSLRIEYMLKYVLVEVYKHSICVGVI